jgi:hypothetical protein
MHEPLPWLIGERIGHDDMLFGGGVGAQYWPLGVTRSEKLEILIL